MPTLSADDDPIIPQQMRPALEIVAAPLQRMDLSKLAVDAGGSYLRGTSDATSVWKILTKVMMDLTFVFFIATPKKHLSTACVGMRRPPNWRMCLKKHFGPYSPHSSSWKVSRFIC